MKKTFTSILFVAFAMSATAQISEGYYHIMNNYTGRYLNITSRQSNGGSVGAANADLDALETQKPLDDICADPGSCIYIKNHSDDSYDMAAQGTSVGSISGGLYPHFTAVDGGYNIWGTYKGVKVVLSDSPQSASKNSGHMSQKGSESQVWSVYKIDGGEHYMGIKPEVNVDGYYWATFYCGFPFRLGSGMKAYYIVNVNDGGFELKEYSGDVVGATCPILIRCKGSKASDNKITPLTSGGSDPSDNKLRGIFFSSSVNGHTDYNNKYNASTQRVLGKSGGKLAFVKASSGDLIKSLYTEHNRCWLVVPSSAESTLTEAGYTGINSIDADDTANKKIYTLQGVEIPEGTTPRPGIYIQNGKKVVIK